MYMYKLGKFPRRTLEKLRENEVEQRHIKEAAVLQLEQKQTLLQVQLNKANRKVKEGEEQISGLQAQLVTVAQNQQRQEGESAEQLKKEIEHLREQLSKEIKGKNKLSETNRSLKEVSVRWKLYGCMYHGCNILTNQVAS